MDNAISIDYAGAKFSKPPLMRYFGFSVILSIMIRDFARFLIRIANNRFGEHRRRKLVRRRLSFENLDLRFALAGDVMSSAGPSVLSSVAEGEAAPDLVAFAKAVSEAGIRIFGADWTAETTNQLKLFDDGARYLNYFEAFNGDRTQNSIGIAENITAVPTWKASNNVNVPAIFTPEELSVAAGIPIPRSNTPSFFPISSQVVAKGSPLHVPIDAYDPNGNPLTFTVTSSQPGNVAAEILQNNQSARISVEGYGEMVFELFNAEAPRVVERFVTLANAGFYNTTTNQPMTFHRSVQNFVIQGGDPLGTGTGGSTLGDFDDQFNLNLQHNRSGILSYAKSFDDTNDSQFFVTAGPTRFLDYNHSIFGQLIEGDRTRAGINRIAVDANDRPLAPVVIQNVTIFNDTENGLLRIISLGDPGSTSDITVTARDSEGNQFSQTFTVTVTNDTSNGAPFLADIPVLKGTTNAPINYQLASTDQEGDDRWYLAAPPRNSPLQITVNSETGAIVVQPIAGFVGEAAFAVYVAREPLLQSDLGESTLFDFQVVRVQISNPFSIAVNPTLTVEKGGAATGTVTRVGVPLEEPFTVSLTSSNPSKLGVPNSVTIPANQSTASFTVTILDNTAVDGPEQVTITGTALSFSANTSINILDDETTSPWHHASSPFDVDRNGFIVPLDVLLVINAIASQGIRLLPVPEQPVQYSIDTDGDYFLTPLDVLRVINFLNIRPSAEGESIATNSDKPETALALTNSTELTHEMALSLWLFEEATGLKQRRLR